MPNSSNELESWQPDGRQVGFRIAFKYKNELMLISIINSPSIDFVELQV